MDFFYRVKHNNECSVKNRYSSKLYDSIGRKGLPFIGLFCYEKGL